MHLFGTDLGRCLWGSHTSMLGTLHSGWSCVERDEQGTQEKLKALVPLWETPH